MDADGYRPGEYGTLTPNPEGEKEEKRKKSKRTVIALAGLAALLAVGGCCVGSGLVQKIVPQREEETVVVEPADDVYVAPTPTEYIVPLSPTPTEAVQEPADVREGWYGNYEGAGTGHWERQRQYYGELTEDHNVIRSDELLWLEILPPEYCYQIESGGEPYCNEDRSWGLEIGEMPFVPGAPSDVFVSATLYLPADLSDAPGLTITEDRIIISPTEEHPYVVEIVKVGDDIEGSLQANGIPEAFVIEESLPEGVERATDWWIIDQFTAGKTSAPHPSLR